MSYINGSEVMEKEGVKADTVTLSSIIAGLCRAKPSRLNQVRMILDHMEKKGPAPNARTYSPIIAALSAMKNFVACFQIIERMESRGLQPNSYCFEPLLRQHNPTEVINQALALMIDRKTPFDPIYEKTFARLTQTSTVKLIHQYKAVAGSMKSTDLRGKSFK